VSRSPGKATHRYHEVSGRGLVRVRAASVNPLDWHFMRGTPYVVRAAAGLSRPKAKGLGADMAGQVGAVGKDVTEFRPGDEVFGSRSGTFAEYVSMPEDGVVLAKPANRGVAWLRLLALDGPLAKAEPKTLRYRILHAAARLARSGRRRRLKISATCPGHQRS
jgi:threonine dehydrogenase-like Zn-dependent dehydrogenase